MSSCWALRVLNGTKTWWGLFRIWGRISCWNGWWRVCVKIRFWGLWGLLRGFRFWCFFTLVFPPAQDYLGFLYSAIHSSLLPLWTIHQSSCPAHRVSSHSNWLYPQSRSIASYNCRLRHSSPPLVGFSNLWFATTRKYVFCRFRAFPRISFWPRLGDYGRGSRFICVRIIATARFIVGFRRMCRS